MAEYLEKLTHKTAEKMKIGVVKQKPPKEKIPDYELGNDIPPEDPNA